MNGSPVSPLLRGALIADAGMSGAAGLLMGVVPMELGLLLETPPELLRWAGLSLLPFAVFVAWVAMRPTLSRTAVLAVVLCNILWAVDSVLLLLSGWVAPNLLGHAFIIAQALAVGIFAELQFVGLKRSATLAT